MVGATLFHDHRHDGVLVRLPALLVNANDLVYPNVADEIARNEDKVGRDDPMRIDVSHGISRRKRLLGSDDRDNLQARAGLGPFGLSVR